MNFKMELSTTKAFYNYKRFLYHCEEALLILPVPEISPFKSLLSLSMDFSFISCSVIILSRFDTSFSNFFMLLWIVSISFLNELSMCSLDCNNSPQFFFSLFYKRNQLIYSFRHFRNPYYHYGIIIIKISYS